MCLKSLNYAISRRGERFWLNLNEFGSPKIQYYCDQILFIGNKQGRSYDIICPPITSLIVLIDFGKVIFES